MLVLKRDPNGHNLYGFDLDEEIFKTAGYVWNTTTLEWERMQQPTVNIGDLTVTMGDVEALLADNYWKRMKPYEHASTRPKYICKNVDIDANETDTDWYIWKYSDADLPTIEGPRQGAVNSEVVIDALPWNT